MPSLISSLTKEQHQSVVAMLLQGLKSHGYNPGNNRERSTAVIHDEWLLRLEPTLNLLSRKALMPESYEQIELGIKLPKRSLNPASFLKQTVEKKYRLVDRKQIVDLTRVAELTLYLSANLAYRGYLGTSDKLFLDRLKVEVEWLLLEYGYKLSPRRVRRCPMLSNWHGYDLWVRLCRVDGVSESAIREIVRQQEILQSDDIGCQGYACESRCQIGLDMSA